MLSCIGFVTAFVVKFLLYRWQKVGRRFASMASLCKYSSKLLTTNVSSFRGRFWFKAAFSVLSDPACVYKYSKNNPIKHIFHYKAKGFIYKNSLRVSTNNFIIRRNSYNSVRKKADLVLKEACLVYNLAMLIKSIKISNIARSCISREHLLIK
jgi:hypothetical protein